MRIEWATLCDELEDTPDSLNILGALRDQGDAAGPLPSVVVPLVAACLVGRLDEFAGGGLVEVAYQVRTPSDEVIPGRRGTYAELGTDSTDYPDWWPVRMILPIRAEFTAAVEG